MFDFNDHYTLDELLALDNFMCYVRASAAESIDIAQLRRDLNKMHWTLSRVINSKLDEAALEWDRAHEVPAVSDPPADPDMFGWVGDALDDLCADVEVLDDLCVDVEVLDDLCADVEVLDDLCADVEVLGSNE